MSDPVFDLSELGAQSPERSAAPNPSESPLSVRIVPRESFEERGGVLLPLPGTEAETVAIRRALGDERARDELVALRGVEATEAQFRRNVEGKVLLHLATHGIVDERKGSLFAALALTPPAGEAVDADFHPIEPLNSNQFDDSGDGKAGSVLTTA